MRMLTTETQRHREEKPQSSSLCLCASVVNVFALDPRAHGERQSLFRLVAQNYDANRDAGLNAGGGAVAVGDAVGPAVVDDQQAIAGFQARGGGGAAFKDLRDRDARVLGLRVFLDAEAKLGRRRDRAGRFLLAAAEQQERQRAERVLRLETA